MPDIDELVAQIRKRYLAIFSEHAKASENSEMLLSDLWLFGLTDRNIALAEAMPPLIKSENIHALGPLLRIQLDGFLRLHAFNLVESVDDLVIHVMHGGEVRDFKDRDGKRLTDRYLVNALKSDLPWVESVYEKLCGRVHFSDHHIFMAAKQGGNAGSIEIGIGSYRQKLPPKMILEAVAAFEGIHSVTADVIQQHFASRRGM